MAHAPPGHHSVVGKPNSGGLSYPEYVVYRGEQVIYSNIPFMEEHAFAIDVVPIIFMMIEAAVRHIQLS